MSTQDCPSQHIEKVADAIGVYLNVNRIRLVSEIETSLFSATTTNS